MLDVKSNPENTDYGTGGEPRHYVDGRATHELFNKITLFRGPSPEHLSVLAARLRLANEQIRTLATCEVEGRGARQFLGFAGRCGRATANRGVFIPIRLKQGDIASLVGAARESVDKILVSYKERRFISVDVDQWIGVQNQQALAKRCR